MKKLLFILLLALVASIGFAQTRQAGTVAVAKVDLYRDGGKPNTLMTLSGVATFSRTNFYKWTNKFFILGGGRGAGTLSTAGYYEIGMPPAGTVIQGVGGIPNQTVSAAGIDMRASAGSWSVLYYVLNAGSQATVNANFRLAGWQADFIVPDNWVMIGAYNADVLTIKTGNGQILKQGMDTDGLIAPFDATIDFSVNTDPNTAGTTFSPNTPANGAVVYVSAINGAQWTHNGTLYVTAPAQPAWQTTGNAATVQATNFLGTVDNVGLSLRTNNQIRQTITNTGDFGFNVPIPLSRVSISGGTYDIGFYNGTPASLNQGKQAVIKAINLGVGQGHLAFETYRGGFGGGERMRITEAGNVVIGAPATNNKFHVVQGVFNPSSNDLASVKVEGSYGGGIAFAEGANRALIWSDSGNKLSFSTGGTVTGTPERMRITETGNVVINGTTATEKLQVGGNIRVTGIANYASTAAALADAALLSGVFYTVNLAGVKQLYVK